MYAVISDRGRQAGVRVGDVITCDRNEDWAPGDAVTFEDVLLVTNEGEARVGTPLVDGVKVTGEVVRHSKGEKLVVYRFKRRKNVRVKNGHRQGHTQVRITGIEG